MKRSFVERGGFSSVSNKTRRLGQKRDKPPKMASSKSSNHSEIIVRNVLTLYSISYSASPRLIEVVSGERSAEYEPVIRSTIVAPGIYHKVLGLRRRTYY